MRLLFGNGYQHVSGDDVLDLRFYRVLAVVDETFATQMLLDPLEEQFGLSTTFVQHDDCVVGQKPSRFTGFRVFEADVSHLLGWRELRRTLPIDAV